MTLGDVTLPYALLYKNPNRIVLTKDCLTFSTVAHEFGHVFGLFHTHTRSDRDNYVELLGTYKNIGQYPSYGNWGKQNTSNYAPYDFGSIMHYPRAMVGKYVDEYMTTKDPLRKYVIGTRTGPSQSDLLQLNMLYKCFDRCSAIKIHCLNGGFQNPNNCVECVCPRGFASRLCETREVTSFNGRPCGATVIARDQWQTVKGGPMSQTAPYRLFPKSTLMCHWHLKTSARHRIEIVLTKTSECNRWSCREGGVEIKLGDFGMGGYKFCCNSHLPKNHVFRTSGSLAHINLDVLKGENVRFELQFRRVAL